METSEAGNYMGFMSRRGDQQQGAIKDNPRMEEALEDTVEWTDTITNLTIRLQPNSNIYNLIKSIKV